MTDRAAPPEHKSSPAQSAATTCLTALLPSQPRVQLLRMTQRSGGNSSSISPVCSAGSPHRSRCLGSCSALSRVPTPAPKKPSCQGSPFSPSGQPGADHRRGMELPLSLQAEMWFPLLCWVLQESFLLFFLSPLAGCQTFIPVYQFILVADRWRRWHWGVTAHPCTPCYWHHGTATEASPLQLVLRAIGPNQRPPAQHQTPPSLPFSFSSPCLHPAPLPRGCGDGDTPAPGPCTARPPPQTPTRQLPAASLYFESNPCPLPLFPLLRPPLLLCF